MTDENTIPNVQSQGYANSEEKLEKTIPATTQELSITEVPKHPQKKSSTHSESDKEIEKMNSVTGIPERPRSLIRYSTQH